MDMDRRAFVALSVIAAAECTLTSGCASSGTPDSGASATGGKLDIGPAAQYSGDGVDQQFRERGFFVVRHGGQVFAISSVCTHRKCIVHVDEKNDSYSCKCHGSKFDADGKVTHGPARRNLPVYRVLTGPPGFPADHLVVDFNNPVALGGTGWLEMLGGVGATL